MFYYVVGANPSPFVMRDFVRRIWRNQGVDNVIMVKKRSVHCLIQINGKEILANYHIFFDIKPIIMKPWNPDIDIITEEIKTIPTWLHLCLDFKYQGERSIQKNLNKLASM